MFLIMVYKAILIQEIFISNTTYTYTDSHMNSIKLIRDVIMTCALLSKICVGFRDGTMIFLQ